MTVEGNLGHRLSDRQGDVGDSARLDLTVKFEWGSAGEPIEL